MSDRVIPLIDQAIDRITSDLMIAAGAIEGVYARVYREDPSARGLNTFMADTQDIPNMAGRVLLAGARDLASTLQQESFPVELNDETLSVASQQQQASLEQLRLIAARRFRAAIVSRSSVAPALSTSMRLMTRAGARLNAEHMFYLSGRKALLDLVNESTIARLRREGQAIAQVSHINPNHSLHGALILIDESKSGLPHYSEVVEKWFHPRASAILTGADDVHP